MQQRNSLIAKARQKYRVLGERNISKALELYLLENGLEKAFDLKLVKKKKCHGKKKCNGKKKSNNVNLSRCAKCGGLSRLYSVNDRPGNQTGDDSKSQWVCLNENCMEIIYNKQSVQEITEERRK